MPDRIRGSEGQPSRFGDYNIHGLIGEGGMARVYAGEEVLSHRRVALKILRAEFANSEKGRQQFLTEMRILANIDDPNIVRCLLCTEIEAQPVMVLELLEGWTLRQMLEHRVALPWREAVAYARQIAMALRTAHTHRPPIVHRDLKPENVMVLPDGRVKVMDFGIAKVVQRMTGSTTHPIGTLRYMSPEQIDAQHVDGRADLFALGLLLWEMLAGQPPFSAESPRVLLDQICNRSTPRLPDHARKELPAQLEQLIEQLLQKDRQARPGSAAEVVGMLERLGGSSMTAPMSAPPRMRTQPGEYPPHVHAARPVQPVQPAQPVMDTINIVETARKGALHKQLDEAHVMATAAADAVNRFADATSALIVRVLIGLFLLPAAAVIFVGVPAGLALIDFRLLTNAGMNIEGTTSPSWAAPELLLLPTCAAAIVFVRACWAHRRPPSDTSMLWPWLIVGMLVIACSVGATVIEIGPGSTLDPAIHVTCIVSAFVWLMLSLCWVTGRLVSRLLQRLEHSPPSTRSI